MAYYFQVTTSFYHLCNWVDSSIVNCFGDCNYIIIFPIEMFKGQGRFNVMFLPISQVSPFNQQGKYKTTARLFGS